MRAEGEQPPRRRRRGQGEPGAAPPGEDLGWLADLRSAKAQRGDLGPEGGPGPRASSPPLPKRRPAEPPAAFTPLSAPPHPPSQGRHGAPERPARPTTGGAYAPRGGRLPGPTGADIAGHLRRR